MLFNYILLICISITNAFVCNKLTNVFDFNTEIDCPNQILENYFDGMKYLDDIKIGGSSNCYETTEFQVPKCNFPKFNFFGRGICLDKFSRLYDSVVLINANSVIQCGIGCNRNQEIGLRGFTYSKQKCLCHYDNGYIDNLEQNRILYHNGNGLIKNLLNDEINTNFCFQLDNSVENVLLKNNSSPFIDSILPDVNFETIGYGECFDLNNKIFNRFTLYDFLEFAQIDGIEETCSSSCKKTAHVFGLNVIGFLTSSNTCECLTNDSFDINFPLPFIHDDKNSKEIIVTKAISSYSAKTCSRYLEENEIPTPFEPRET